MFLQNFLDKHDNLKKSLFNIASSEQEFKEMLAAKIRTLSEGDSFKVRIKDGVREIQKKDGKIIILKLNM